MERSNSMPRPVSDNAEQLAAEAREISLHSAAAQERLRQALRAGADTSAARQELETLTAEGTRIGLAMSDAIAVELQMAKLRVEDSAQTLAAQSARVLLDRLAAFKLPVRGIG